MLTLFKRSFSGKYPLWLTGVFAGRAVSGFKAVWSHIYKNRLNTQKVNWHIAVFCIFGSNSDMGDHTYESIIITCHILIYDKIVYKWTGAKINKTDLLSWTQFKGSCVDFTTVLPFINQ